ncbi:hypothetical protein Bca4012_065228 [Brassica carinata]|uniref:Uncharacterized protein n=1 Tax=Brassica carinata TaxID=52824 RepID=A0A8X7VP27_BRACI|nr:hypothetical protein Bca52824_017655 [Brassica carinata]
MGIARRPINVRYAERLTLFSFSFCAVGHPNVATYSEDWKERARTIALQRQDCWSSFTRDRIQDRIQRSIDRIAYHECLISAFGPFLISYNRIMIFSFSESWISEPNPLIKSPANKRLPLFSRIEQKEINRARAMKELPDLSRIMAARTSARKGGSGGEVDPPSPIRQVTVPAADARTPKEGTAKKVTSKKKKKQGPEVHGEGPSERVHTGDGPKKGKKKKRKATDEENKALRVATEDPEEPSSEEVPLKKRRKKKETGTPRPSSVCEDELRDNIRFEFNRELPLSFYPEECGRLIRSVKGGPDPLPPIGGLIFEEEYAHAACSSVKSHGDWNVLVGKYDAALKRAQEQILAGEEEQRRIEVAHGEALQVAIREKEEAVAREKALRREFNETRSSDLAELESCKDSMKDLQFVVDKLEKEKADLERARAADLMKHAEEANRLRKSRKYEVTHERVRVMIAMISKAERCFNRIRLRETKRDAYDEAREVVRSAGSSTHRAGSESVRADQALPIKAPGADRVEAPVIVLSDSPSKFLKAAGLVGSSSEDSETESEDSGPKDQGREGDSNPP